jgi:lysyl-tRNA synthetase class 2
MSAPFINVLQARSELLRKLRQFFYDRGFVEVETPLLLDEVIPEQHIEPLIVESSSTKRLILQASPELCMKRLMAAGTEAIFQITRSFRAGERGKLHRPEFTIVEWYRRGDDMRAGMDLLDELCQATLNTGPAERLRYQRAFERYLGICPLTCATSELTQRVKELSSALPEGLREDDRDGWLSLLLATSVEPQLGWDRPTILYDYPASQASLAMIRDEGTEPAVAERFELYVRGVELANGFHELTDAEELRLRLERANERRLADGRRSLPMPESLLAALENGLPNCAGAALGFDRLLMLALGAESISDVTTCCDLDGMS